MPTHQMAMKDVANCDKLRRAVSELRPGDFRMGQPGRLKTCHLVSVLCFAIVPSESEELSSPKAGSGLDEFRIYELVS